MERIFFVGIGASVARLLPRDSATASNEATQKCLIAPNIAAQHPIDYADESQLIPVDLSKEAGKCDWDLIEHDGWGVRIGRDGPTGMDPSAEPCHGVSVTTIGFESWPMYSTWVGGIYIVASRYEKYRSRIETVNRRWPPSPYRAAELTTVRTADGRRYMGFYGRVVESAKTADGIAKLEIYRAGTLEPAGAWYFNFQDKDEVDAGVSPGALNDSGGGSAFPSLGTQLNAASTGEGYVFLSLRRSAELWDRSTLGYTYGLTGPKLPFWLEG